MKTFFDKALEKATLDGVSKVTFNEVNTKKGKGWSFSVYWGDRDYPNMVSSAVKTNKGSIRQATRYLNTGEFSLYGNAE